MISKIYEKMKKFIKDNYKDIIILFIVILIAICPLPYYIYTSGGTININDRVIIDNSYKSEGSLNLAYVSQIRATIPSFLVSYVIPNWEREKIDNYKASSKESDKDIEVRDKLYLEESNLNALKVAYNAAGKTLDIKNNKYHIVYVDDKVEENIKVGDVILKADGSDIVDLKDYKALVDSKDYGDIIKLELLRNNKELTVDVKVRKIDDRKLTGISLVNIYEYTADPSIKFKFDKNESGSSGGLMLALSIYDKLTPDDLTRGKKIVGTGTIDSDGKVGEIGGVKYKLMGAVKAKASVFLAPKGENYNECIKLQKEKNYKIKILEIDTFEDALNKLKEI